MRNLRSIVRIYAVQRYFVLIVIATLPHLEKVVFQEVPHWLVCRDGPPRVEVEVEDVEPDDQDERAQLGLVADRHQDHQDGADQVLHDVHDRSVEPATTSDVERVSAQNPLLVSPL